MSTTEPVLSELRSVWGHGKLSSVGVREERCHGRDLQMAPGRA